MQTDLREDYAPHMLEGNAGRRTVPVILVVDDDEYVHSTLAAAMSGLRPEIIRAATAADGLQLALDRRPDIAIVDVGLPDLDGYALTRAMRARPELADLRICILTGHLPDEARARDAGANAIIGKPFRLNELLDTIRSQLRTTAGS
jgi:two-component system KDP operon response regulator KdpE